MENKEYKCDICNKIFKTGVALGLHKKYCYPGKINKKDIYKYPNNICPYCGYKSTSKPGIARHVRICKQNPNFDKDFYNKYYINNFGAAWNKGLTKETDERIKKYGNTYTNKCKTGEIQIWCKNKQMTPEFKKKVSEGRKQYLLEHPDEHPWKNSNKFISKPCEYLKEKLKENNIDFTEEYSPLENRNFSIDIVFLDKKIGIEVNGNQHYDNDGNLTQYYQERHELIESAGWKLFEIHYYDVYKDNIINKIKYILMQ